MSKILSISNKLISMRSKILIDDEQGIQKYMAKREMFVALRPFNLYRGGNLVATIRSKVFAMSQTWVVNSDALGRFLIRKKIFTWIRTYQIRGGKYDGTVIRGSVRGLKFTILAKDREIAAATSKILSLADRQSIEVHKDDPEDELLTAIVMTSLHIAKKQENAAR